MKNLAPSNPSLLRHGSKRAAPRPLAGLCRRTCVALAGLIALLLAPAALAETIASARYIEPVDRYGHYALGRPHEYAGIEVTTGSGERLVLRLPPEEVFEDLKPRLVRLSENGPVELLTIVSGPAGGARLVLLGLRGSRLEVGAQSPPIGTPMRWLAPVGVADLDGDGSAEVAAVLTPHIGGVLKVYRRENARGGGHEGARLVEVASLAGFSNHVYGSTELGLSAPVAVDGRMRLAVPDLARTTIRLVGLEGGRLVDVGRCALANRITAPLQPAASGALRLDQPPAPAVVIPRDCSP